MIVPEKYHTSQLATSSMRVEAASGNIWKHQFVDRAYSWQCFSVLWPVPDLPCECLFLHDPPCIKVHSYSTKFIWKNCCPDFFSLFTVLVSHIKVGQISGQTLHDICTFCNIIHIMDSDKEHMSENLLFDHEILAYIHVIFFCFVCLRLIPMPKCQSLVSNCHVCKIESIPQCINSVRHHNNV